MRILTITLILFFILKLQPMQAQDLTIEVPKSITENSYLLDGVRSSSFWARSKILPQLIKNESTENERDKDCQIEIVETNSWVIFGVNVSEKKNIIVTEYMNNEPQWFDDNILIELGSNENLSVQINPLGASVVSVNGKISLEPIKEEKIKICARINKELWRVEMAISKSLIRTDLSKTPLKIVRQKQHRGFDAFQTSSLQLTIQLSALLPDNKDIFALHRQIFENQTLFNGVFKNILPEKISDWETIPYQELTLASGDNSFDNDFQKTKVKLVTNNDEILVSIECSEKHIKDLFSEPSSLENDSVEIFLTPDGFRYIGVVITPENKVSAHIGLTGGRRVRSRPVPTSAKSEIIKDDSQWTILYRVKINELLEFGGVPNSYTPTAYPWQIQIVRNRGYRKKIAQKSQESQLAISNSATSHCPIRFAKLVFSNNLVQKPVITEELLPPLFKGDEKSSRELTEVFKTWVNDKKKIFHQTQQEKRDNIKNKEQWVAYKNETIKNILTSLFPNSNGVLPKQTDTKPAYGYSIEKDNIIIKGVIFKSRKDIPVTGTLFLPLDYEKRKKMPAMIMIPAHHTPRNCFDIYCLAKNLADQGCLAIAIDTLGSGERGIAARWNHKNHQRNLIGHQLNLAGEEITGWAVVDIISTVDYLLERKDIDTGKIAVIGGVAGGGDIAGLSGALDERISVTIPFNYSSNTPISGWYDLTRSLPNSHFFGITPWVISALVAPRQLISAEEFDWNESKILGYEKFSEVYGYYNAKENLTKIHGDKNTHASSFLSLHRVQIYKILNNWWGLKLPETTAEEKRLSLQDGHLEVMPTKNAKDFIKQNFSRKTEEITEQSIFREPNFLAEKTSLLQRKVFQKANQKEDFVLVALSEIFKDTKPFDGKMSQISQPYEKYNAEKVWVTLDNKLSTEKELIAPIWLFTPKETNKEFPLVLCLSQEGKTVFFSKRKNEIKTFLENGFAVALVDVRGVGETEATSFRLPEFESASLGINLWQMKDNLTNYRIKDTKTIIKALTSRTDISNENITLWGEGFSEPNGKDSDIMKFEETGFRQATPGSKRLVEPLGMNLAIFTPLLLDAEFKVKRIIVRGGLISYESLLKDFYYYMPSDAFIPNLLTKIDLPDVIAALRKKGVFIYMEDLRDGKNCVVSEENVKKTYYNELSYYSSTTTNNLVEKILAKKEEIQKHPVKRK